MFLRNLVRAMRCCSGVGLGLRPGVMPCNLLPRKQFRKSLAVVYSSSEDRYCSAMVRNPKCHLISPMQKKYGI